MPEVLADHFLVIEGEPPRRGGLSVVRKAVDTRNGAFVAVKYVNAATDALTRKIFDREVATLRALSHPNIMRLIEAGIDDSGTYFLILGWVEKNLPDLLSERGPLPWEHALSKLGLPLAEAVAHAHLKHVEHRDIKPANVLIAADGAPMLADFGIGKLRQGEQTDLTVAAFRSGIYAPPELEPLPYVRDVYSLAVLIIQSMHESPIRDYHEIAAALGSLPAPPGIRQLLERSTDSDPTIRPSNGSVFLEQLRSELKANRRQAAAGTHLAWLQLTRAARQQMVGPEGDPNEADPIVLKDLHGEPTVEYRWDPENAERDSNIIFLTGDSLRLTVKPDTSSGQLVVTSARTQEFEALEVARRRGMPVGGWLTWTTLRPSDDQLAKAGLSLLQESLDAFYAERGLMHEERPLEDNGDDLLEVWGRLLQAREELARGELGTMAYDHREQNRRELRLTLTRESDAELIGTDWEVRQPNSKHRLLVGEVIFQSGREVTLLIRGRTRAVPETGELVRHLGPSQAALQRQHDALAAVRSGGSASSDLGALLQNPSLAAPPKSVSVDAWQGDLDQDKKAAVSAALGSRDLLLVKGPPGTGKTSFITELVTQFLRREPEARILIVSQTHVALDNALERLDNAGITGLVRLGNPDDPRISSSIQQLLLDEKMAKWATTLRAKADKHMQSLAQGAGLSHDHLQAALALQQLLASLRLQERIEAHLTEQATRGSISSIATSLGIAEDEGELQQRLDDLAEQQGELRERALRHLAGDLTLRTEVSADDAQAAMDALLGGSPNAMQLLRLLELQAEWLQRVASDSNLAAAFLQTSRVIAGTCLGFLRHPAVRALDIDLCILDEASKATATEALVPLARAKRSVLVGDTNQLPPLDEDLLRRSDLLDDHRISPSAVKETLFQRLADRLPRENQYELLEQYRMIRPIGDLVSTCFYDGKLRSPRTTGLQGYNLLGKPVLWLDTYSLRERRREDPSAGASPSFANRAEAQVVISRLQSIDAALQKRAISPPPGKSTLDVLVIAPYSSQIAELKRRLAGFRSRHLEVSIESVDAVQGRESDLALFSVTRSNAQGRLGFLGQDYWRRINVALSRARYGLTIVGDADFCSNSPGALRQVLEYMRSRPSDCEIRVADHA